VTAANPRIVAFGEHRPARIVRNDDLPAELDTNDEWIRTRTGIRERRFAGADESVVSMATDAAAKAVAGSGIAPADLDLVIVATCSMPTQVPGAAAQVAHALGATRAGAFDLNAACAGFCYALSVAADMIRVGSARHIVVVGAEKLSDLIDWSDRRSAILFGDGAGAAVVATGDRCGIGPVVWGSDGSLADLIAVPAAGKLTLDGPAVFRWATTSLIDVAREVCAAADTDIEALDLVVPHQANQRIVAALARGLGATKAVVADDITDTGNTSAASIPLALSRMTADGRAKPGDRALLLGFGAGLTWAGQLIEIP
jgi:3-oxoacyl-[acyl-carrier-protein] synthase-3